MASTTIHKSKSKTEAEEASVSEAATYNDVFFKVPESILPILAGARELLLSSISDAKKMKMDENWLDAVGWLFYSKDSVAWSFAWVTEFLGMAYDVECSTAQARLNMIKD